MIVSKVTLDVTQRIAFDLAIATLFRFQVRFYLGRVIVLLKILLEFGLGNVVIRCEFKIKTTEIIEYFNKWKLLQDCMLFDLKTVYIMYRMVLEGHIWILAQIIFEYVQR